MNTLTTRAKGLFKVGDYISMDVLKYRRKYWLFGKFIEVGRQRKTFQITEEQSSEIRDIK
jgi:hypothetical protein